MRDSGAGPAPCAQRWDNNVPSAGRSVPQNSASSRWVQGREEKPPGAHEGACLESVAHREAAGTATECQCSADGLNFALGNSDELRVSLSWCAGRSESRATAAHSRSPQHGPISLVPPRVPVSPAAGPGSSCGTSSAQSSLKG